jgi:hypothetical protein
LDPNAYFEFTIIPNTDKKIDFVSFEYTGQTSANGPILFAFRSSVDGFMSDIGTIAATGSNVSLSASAFQNVSSAITFRLYGWAAITGTGSFSINDFQFNGVVSCAVPQITTLPETSFSCLSTSVILSWLPSLHASSYFIDVAKDSDFTNNLVNFQNKDLGNVLSVPLENLSAGETYYVRIYSANGCATSSYSNTIKISPPETVYNGSWSNGIPDATKNARFSNDYIMDTSFEACSCQIDDGVSILVENEAVLKLQNGLKVLGSGSLTFENNASLVQVNDAGVNSGKIIYKRNTNAMKNFDYTHWSSPVNNQQLDVLSPNTLSDKYFSYANGAWVTELGGNYMNPAGKGFIIRVPKSNIHFANGEFWNTPTYIQKVVFEGIPNNGAISIPAQGVAQYNLIGNPYPSAINADDFINSNRTVINGALYFWTHNTAITQNGSFYVYNSNDYAVYNLSGGTSGALMNRLPPSGQIAAGVSFFVETKATGNFVFNNSMRISVPTSNSQFFKMSKANKGNDIEKNRVWLNLTNDGGAFKQLLVGYIAGATDDLDSLYDAASFDGNNFVDFYSINKETNYTIQGRGLPFRRTDKVPLGYKSTLEGEFIISIANADGALINQTIFLEDKTTGKIHNLKNGPYSFTTSKGTFNDRFVLLYSDKSLVLDPTLGNPIFDKAGESVIVSVKNHQIKINSFEEIIAKVGVYDLQGRLLYENNSLNKNEHVISSLFLDKQLLIVVVELKNGTKLSKEIIH